MDATALGSLLVGVGAVVGGAVAYLGKRSENALTGYSSLTNDLQEERDRLDRKVNDLLTEQSTLRAAHRAELDRLRAIIIELGGQP